MAYREDITISDLEDLRKLLAKIGNPEAVVVPAATTWPPGANFVEKTIVEPLDSRYVE